MEKLIQDMANVIWKQFPRDFDGDRSSYDYEHEMTIKFPDLKFSYSIQTDEWILLTDLMLL